MSISSTAQEQSRKRFQYKINKSNTSVFLKKMEKAHRFFFLSKHYRTREVEDVANATNLGITDKIDCKCLTSTP